TVHMCLTHRHTHRCREYARTDTHTGTESMHTQTQREDPTDQSRHHTHTDDESMPTQTNARTNRSMHAQTHAHTDVRTQARTDTGRQAGTQRLMHAHTDVRPSEDTRPQGVKDYPPSDHTHSLLCDKHKVVEYSECRGG